MIKGLIKEGVCEVTIAGSLPDISSEIALLISKCYQGFTNADEEMGKLFKESMQECLLTDDSPVWGIGNE